MLTIINPNKMTKDPFFLDLVNYLDSENDVTLRQLKKAFSHIPNLDRKLDTYIKEGFVSRANRRYQLMLPALPDWSELRLDQMLLLSTTSPFYQTLQELEFVTELCNQTNECLILEKTRFERQELSLSNYFYKLKNGYKLSPEQEPLYALLGDVNPEYALKYMSSFLLKCLKKDSFKQKRPDIFCQALLILGYLKEVDFQTYALNMAVDKERFIFTAF